MVLYGLFNLIRKGGGDSDLIFRFNGFVSLIINLIIFQAGEMADDDFGQEIGDEVRQQMALDRELLEREFKEKGWHYYERPQPTHKYPEVLKFMQTDCDYYIQKDEPIIRMFGVTLEGNSVLLHVRGFAPYFYIPFPDDLDPKKLNEFKDQFNDVLQQQRQFQKQKLPPIQHLELVMKESIRFYKGNDKCLCRFLKISTSLPTNVQQIRSYLKEPRQIYKIDMPDQSFESNMPYALRFMIDKEIVGMGWVSVTKYQQKAQKMSCCQLEYDAEEQFVHPISLDDQSEIAPLRVLSFDIECSAVKGFPNEKNDPVIQIACVVKNHNQTEELVKTVFTLDTCESIPGVRVCSYQKEEALLEEFQLFIQALDPDFITGYNIQNFDFPYLIKRAEHLKIKNYAMFSRIISYQSKIAKGKFLSKAMGMRDTQEIEIQGRIQIDMMMHMMREHKLSSYSLNNVSFQFLKQQKEDVHHSIIHKLQNTSAEARKRIAVYCVKDALLPILLMDKLFCIYNYSEMARVTGVPINYLFVRGQQIKVASQLYRKASKKDLIIPFEAVKKDARDATYEGAFVLDPIRAYYTQPIATLDFASLYPSIMMAHNMCYSTLLRGESKLNPEDITKVPDSDIRFVKNTVRKGVLPEILEDLINARKRARQQLAKETDPFKKAVLDGRQLALKISANSVYGFTGATVGQLPCLEISASITAFGRTMIKDTQRMVEENYPNAKVIYGDTDSVMVNFGVNTIEEAMKLGKEAADKISAIFIKPIKLEFEKVYCPYLLMNRKRYAGMLYTKPDMPDKIDTKGIESVRRDNCFLIRKMVSSILELLLRHGNKEAAVNYAKEQISNLFQNKIDISELVITKSLNQKKEDKNDPKEKDKNKDQTGKLTQNYKQNLAHVKVAEKMQKRDEANAPAAGDRIAYIIVQGSKGSKTYENAEDPVEVLLKGYPIDFDYYLNNQIEKPLLRLFEHVIPNAESIFKGDHTKVRYIPKLNMQSALGKFVQKKNTCLGCKAPIDNTDAVCFNCKNTKALEILTKNALELSELQANYHQFWTTCQGCQGSLHGDIICSNRDCEIYYKRIKVQSDLKDKWDDYDKLQFVDW